MTKTEVFFEVVKDHTDKAVLVPPTQVTFNKEDGGVTRYVGGFYMSEDKQTLVEVNAYSPQFIFFKAHHKSGKISSLKEATIAAAQTTMEALLT